MAQENHHTPPSFGTEALRLPDELRGPLKKHLADLQQRYENLDWARRVGFGQHPALIVIDLALAWTDPNSFPFGSNIDTIVEASCRLLDAARRAAIPIFFTTSPHGAVEPRQLPSKSTTDSNTGDENRFQLDPRLARRDTEKIIYKHYASAFKSTNLLENLCALNVDTLIVSGVSTSHCVYATCRDAAGSVRVIVGREAVGERCEIFHEVNLLDIEIDLGDVMPVNDIVEHLDAMSKRR